MQRGLAILEKKKMRKSQKKKTIVSGSGQLHQILQVGWVNKLREVTSGSSLWKLLVTLWKNIGTEVKILLHWLVANEERTQIITLSRC